VLLTDHLPVHRDTRGVHRLINGGETIDRDFGQPAEALVDVR
jgi:hypothetical protein